MDKSGQTHEQRQSAHSRVGDRITIYQRGKRQIYVADFRQDGRHQRISLETRNLKVATQRAVKLDAELTDGTFKPPPAPITIEKAIEQYLAFLKTECRARKTLVRYQGELHHARDFFESIKVTRLAQIMPIHFDGFRAHCKQIGHGLRTMFHEAVVVKQWLKWCHRRYLVAVNSLADYQLTKPVLEPRDSPSLEQVNAILGAAIGHRKTQYAMLAFTGMRSGELQRLRVEDVDLKHGWISIVSREGAETKTRHSRRIPIHGRLRPLLATMPKSKRPWFFTAGVSTRYPKGDHWINPKRLNEDFIKLLESLELPTGRKQRGLTIHSLRNFMETFCVNAGIPQRVIDTWLGHRSDRSRRRSATSSQTPIPRPS